MTFIPYKINTIYQTVVKVLQQENHQDHFNTQMPSAEVLTLATYSALENNGNYTKTLTEFKDNSYFQYILEISRFGRRVKALVDLFPRIITEISNQSLEYIKQNPLYNLFQNIRIGGCGLTGNNKIKSWIQTKNGKFRRETDDNYRGFVASKHEYYYGFKLNLLTDIFGVPRLHSLHPAAMGGLETLSHLHFDLPYGSELLADKIYNCEEIEFALLTEGVTLKPLRKRNSLKNRNYFDQIGLQSLRKVVETALSLLNELMPRLRSTNLEGAIVKAHLSVLAFSFYQGFRLGFLS
jgi:hypothetical protein